jgi:hypothetical protein
MRKLLLAAALLVSPFATANPVLCERALADLSKADKITVSDLQKQEVERCDDGADGLLAAAVKIIGR